jgi:facilitated trehalose transporter
MMFFFLQVTGMNAVGFYATSIFQNSGININPLLATCIIGLFQLVFVLASAFLIDKCGRKILLFLSFTLMAIGMFGMAAYFNFKHFFVSNDLHWLPLLFLCIFTAGFAVGAGPIPFVLTGELFSQSAKRILAPSTQIVYFFMAFVVTRVFVTMVVNVGAHVAFYMFGGFCVLGFIFVAAVLPETKGKSFNEIQKLLHRQ